MPGFKSVMDIFKLLEKTNCRQCDEKTCLAFASAVFKGARPLADCPRVPAEIASLHGGRPAERSVQELEIEQQMAELREKVTRIDFASAAARIAADYDGRRLVLKIMGKDFAVDADGKIQTDIHVNPWVTIPILNYILHCQGAPLTGKWVPLRELPGGKDWYRLFGQRCEKPLKKVADSYPDLFADLVEVFSGEPVENHYQSDVALVLRPLPLVPLLICYWRPDEGLESDLNLFFDANAEVNLGIGGIYALGAGITRMFEKMALTHGGGGQG